MEYGREKYLKQLNERKQNGLIKVITGFRRAGKSYIMNELYYRNLLGSGIPSTHIIKFAFDSDEDIDQLESYYPDQPTRIKQINGGYVVNSKKFRAFIKDRTNEEGDYYLLLDEIQILEDFIGTLNGFLRHKEWDIYVTGSNSRFLSTDIATEFKGRGSEVHVLPLVFSEYIQGNSSNLEDAWNQYIVTGGIPLVAKMQSNQERMTYLKTLCEESYLKDIVQRHNVRKETELGDIFNILASAIGSPLNISRIRNTFKSVVKKELADDTIDKYISYFEESLLVSRVKKYNIKGRRYIGSPFKVYFEDTGVRNARLNFMQIEETHLMENILYNELRYRGFNVDVGEVDINEKTDRIDVNGKRIYSPQSCEVDFIASLGNLKFYIQSALDITSEAKRINETKSLYYINDSFKKIIVTRNGLAPSVDDKGVLTIDLFDFLRDENILNA